MSAQVLIAGIGNIFLGDDGFGIEVVKLLVQVPLPPQVRVVDFGIRGIDFAYAINDPNCEALIVVDAVSRGQPPGTLYVLDPEFEDRDNLTDNFTNKLAAPLPQERPSGVEMAFEAHALDPFKALRWAKSMGHIPHYTRIVGCEVNRLHDIEFAASLSPAVNAAVTAAVEIIIRLANEALAENQARLDLKLSPCTS